MDLQLFRWREPAWLKGFKAFEELPGADEAAAGLLSVLESECSLCDRTGRDTKPRRQSITPAERERLCLQRSATYPQVQAGEPKIPAVIAASRPGISH